MNRFPAGDVVGRTAELSALMALVDGVRSGIGGLGWVQGEPGIGKSTVLTAALAAAQGAGCATLRGAGDQLMEAFPLRLMADSLGVVSGDADPKRAEIADLLRGDSGRLGVADPLLAATERMLELVDRRCAAAPLVLAVEDLQWADEPSLLVWNRLARAVDQIPLLLIGSCRPVPRRPIVARLAQVVHERGGAVIILGPVDTEAGLAIAAQLTGARTGPVLAAQLARAGGNPLYLRELVESLRGEGLIVRTGEVADLAPGTATTPGSLTAAISRRLGFLSARTIRDLRSAALLGNEFDVGQWCLAVNRSVAGLTDTVNEAVTAGVLTDAGDRLGFRHDLIRQVLAEQWPAAVRTVLHGHLARALADADAELDVVARHLLLGPQRIGSWVPPWLAGKPESSLYAAPEVSAALLRRALEVAGTDAAEWDVLAARLAQVLFWLGQHEPAVQIANQVLARSVDPARTANLRIHLLRAAGRTRRFEQGLAVAEVGLADPALPPLWRGRLTAWAALTMGYVSRIEEGIACAERALAEAERCGDPLGIAYAHHALAYLSPAPSQLTHINAALAVLGTDSESMDLRTLLLSNRMHRLVVNGRRDDLRAAVAEAMTAAEQIGTYRAGQLLAQAAGLGYLFGEWDDTLVHADSIGPEFLKNSALTYVHGLVALVALHREEPERAEAHLLAGRFVGPDAIAHPETMSGFVADALALREEVRGQPDRALAVRATLLTMLPGPDRDARCAGVLYLTRLALAQQDRGTAEAAALLLAPSADSAADVLITARCCRGLVAGDAAAVLVTAGEYGELGYQLDRALALEEAAVLLADAGDLTGARSAHGDAVRAYARMGATWDIRRADARMRRRGIRRGPHTIRRRSTVGWAALTPSELRVARLVARGLSNPDIAGELMLSRNTVQTHVSHILSKLQLRSRIELIREVAERTATVPDPGGGHLV